MGPHCGFQQHPSPSFYCGRDHFQKQVDNAQQITWAAPSHLVSLPTLRHNPPDWIFQFTLCVSIQSWLPVHEPQQQGFQDALVIILANNDRGGGTDSEDWAHCFECITQPFLFPSLILPSRDERSQFGFCQVGNMTNEVRALQWRKSGWHWRSGRDDVQKLNSASCCVHSTSVNGQMNVSDRFSLPACFVAKSRPLMSRLWTSLGVSQSSQTYSSDTARP